MNATVAGPITGLRDDDVITFQTSTGRTTVTLTREKDGCFLVDVHRGGKVVKGLGVELETEAGGRRRFDEYSRMVQNEDQLVALLAEVVGR